MPVKGTNFKDDPQLLDTAFALFIENYFVHGTAKMQKRPGQVENFDTGESTPIPLDKEFRYGIDIEAYGTKVRSYDNATGTFTNIKTDFTSGAFTGGRYGDYFFVNTPLDGLWRLYFQFSWAESYNLSGNNTFDIAMQLGTSISAGQILTDSTTGHTGTVVSVTVVSTTSLRLVVNTLNGAFTLGGPVTGGTLVSATLQNVNPFTANNKITGATTGATAIILEQTDSGATGSFVLGSILGTFNGSEVVTDTGTGRAVMTTSVTIGITQVTNAPKADVFIIIGKRAALLGLATNKAGGVYSNADTGSNPVWTNWTTGTGYNDPGDFSNRNGGDCLDGTLIGNIVFVGQENGWFAFTIDQYSDADGNSLKKDAEVATGTDFPVFRCVMTNVGMIVASTAGIFRLVSLGQPNIPYSDQWEGLTEDLGEDYFTDVNWDDVDIMYDNSRGFIYTTLGKDSDNNNLVLSVKATLSGTESDVKTGATSFFTGWNVLNFMVTQEGIIYGTSAIDGIRHQLFVGQKDVQKTIHTEYLQELNFALTDTFNLEQFMTKIEMSGASLVTISFDTFDETGYYEARRRTYQFRPRHDYTDDEAAWGSAPWGSAGWGGGSTVSGLIPTKRGRLVKLRQLTRVWLRYESDDACEHIINYFSARALITKPTRDNSLELVTD